MKQLAGTIRKRRPVSLTSLIDVIFLLLLFFMLTSTFSKYNEFEVSASKAGGGNSTAKPNIFISLGVGAWRINGIETTADGALAVLENFGKGEENKAIIQIHDDVTSQALVDALELLRKAEIPVTLVN